jgi:hypothetical protein
VELCYRDGKTEIYHVFEVGDDIRSNRFILECTLAKTVKKPEPGGDGMRKLRIR